MGMTYLALGDSTTKTITTGPNYTELVYQYIRDNYTPLKFIHKGISGLKAEDLVTNPWYFSNFDADLITYGMGFNNFAAGAGGVAAFQSNVGNIIDRLLVRNPKAKIILCTSNNGLSTGDLPLYRQALVDVAIAKGIDYCRFETAWTPAENGTYTSDGVHPNTAGYALLFNLLKPIIDEILG